MKTGLYLHQPIYLLSEPRREDFSNWELYLMLRARWINEMNKQLRLRPFLKNYAENGVVNQAGGVFFPSVIHVRPPQPNT